MIDLDKVRQLCDKIAERTGPDGHPDVLTLLAAMSDTLDACELLQTQRDEAREELAGALLAANDATQLQAERDEARAEVDRLRADIGRATARANSNARLAADNADERDTATQQERERIANWFTAEADHWRITNNTEAQCEYDRAAAMVRDSAGGEG